MLAPCKLLHQLLLFGGQWKWITNPLLLFFIYNLNLIYSYIIKSTESDFAIDMLNIIKTTDLPFSMEFCIESRIGEFKTRLEFPETGANIGDGRYLFSTNGTNLINIPYNQQLVIKLDDKKFEFSFPSKNSIKVFSEAKLYIEMGFNKD